MTTWKQLSASLRLTLAAPWCLLAALLFAGAAGMIDVKIDPISHEPINTTVNLSGTHWTGTLDPARLPASVPLLGSDQSLALPGALIWDGGLSSSDGIGNIYFGNSLYIGNSSGSATIYGPSATWTDDGSGTWTASAGICTDTLSSNGSDPAIQFDSSTGYLLDGGGTVLSWTYSGVNVPGNLSVGNDLNPYGNMHVAGTATFTGAITGTTATFSGNPTAHGLNVGPDGIGSQGNVVSAADLYANGATAPTLFFNNSASMSRVGPGIISAGTGSRGSTSGTFLSAKHDLVETATQPAAVAGQAVLWTSSSDHKLHVVDSTGTDHALW